MRLNPDVGDAAAVERLASLLQGASGVEEVRFDQTWIERITLALLVLRVGFAVGESWYVEMAAQVLGVDAVRFLPPDMGLVVARSTRSGAEISGEP